MKTLNNNPVITDANVSTREVIGNNKFTMNQVMSNEAFMASFAQYMVKNGFLF